MRNPTLSIVMPMYNVEDFVEKAVKSVLEQEFQDWELIIVNDGSTDCSPERALTASNGDSRIRIVNKSNGGLSDARNYGLKQAIGKYIHFFDSDDWISRDFYKQTLNDIIKSGNDILICGYTVDSFHANGKHDVFRKDIKTALDSTSELSDFISGYFNFAWNKLFRRSFLIENNLWFEKGLKYIEDCEFMSRVVSLNPSVTYGRATGYHYRNDQRNTLSRVFDRSLIHISERRIECCRKILPYISANPSAASKAIDMIRFNTVRFLLHSLFSYSRNISRCCRYKAMKEILASGILKPTCAPKHLVSGVDFVMWILIQYSCAGPLFAIYSIKKR